MASDTTTPDPQAIMQELLGPGGQFEVTVEEVRGNQIKVFADRHTSLRDVLTASAARGDHPLMMTVDREISYAEHHVAATSLGMRLRNDFGVQPGDRVGMLAGNSPEWVTAFWAATWAGAVPVGLNSWSSSTEVEHMLGTSDPAVVFVDEAAAGLVPDDFSTILMPDEMSDLTAPLDGAADLDPGVETSEDDAAGMLFTSGTSGRPKGVLYSHRNFCAVINYHLMNDVISRRLGAPDSPPRRDLMVSPLFHIAGLHNLGVARLAAGTTLVIYEGRFDAARLLDLIQDRKVTNWGAVPTMVSRMLELDNLDSWDLSSLRSFALASAPSSPTFKQRVRDALPVAEHALTDSYGMTETSTALTVAPPQLLSASPGTVGMAIPTVELEVRKEDGTPADEGEPGEVWVRSQFNMLGYWRNSEATEEALTDDGWLRTGDLGRMVHGMLHLDVRRSDLIIRGGENIRPAEVQEALSTHPDVMEAAVVGVDHADLGQEVGALVALTAGSDVDVDALRDHLQDQIAKFKIPTRWVLTGDRLPRNATGKLIRTEVLQRLTSAG